jgi:dihydropteroate synthase
LTKSETGLSAPLFYVLANLPPSMHWQTSRFNIDLSAPKVMGIVNVTPDSFSDGGAHASGDAAKAAL